MNFIETIDASQVPFSPATDPAPKQKEQPPVEPRPEADVPIDPYVDDEDIDEKPPIDPAGDEELPPGAGDDEVLAPTWDTPEPPKSYRNYYIAGAVALGVGLVWYLRKRAGKMGYVKRSRKRRRR